MWGKSECSQEHLDGGQLGLASVGASTLDSRSHVALIQWIIVSHFSPITLNHTFLERRNVRGTCQWGGSEVTENKAMSQLATGALSFKKWLLEIYVHVRLLGSTFCLSLFFFSFWGQVKENQNKYIFKIKKTFKFEGFFNIKMHFIIICT